MSDPTYTIIKSYERKLVVAIHAQSCIRACHTLDFLDFISIPSSQKDDFFNFVETLESFKWGKNWENELSKKEKNICRSNYNRVQVSYVLGDQNGDVMRRTRSSGLVT
jgi:hypothetical protein